MSAASAAVKARLVGRTGPAFVPARRWTDGRRRRGARGLRQGRREGQPERHDPALDDDERRGAEHRARPTTTGPPTADDKKTDLALLRTATSLELLAVAVYGKAEPLLKSADIRAAARLFASQHREHAEQLQAATEEALRRRKGVQEAERGAEEEPRRTRAARRC